MSPLIEVNVYEAHAAKQTAKGTPAAVPTRRFKQPAGAMVTNPDIGSEGFSDGTVFGDQTDWFNSILGQGTPGFEASSDELAWWLWVFHGAETVSPAGTNEVQTLTITGTPTGGTVTLTYDGRTTATISFNAAAAAVQAALEALPNIGTGNVLAAGGPWPGTAITITFQGALAKRPVPNIVLGTNALTGGASPTLTVAETTPGVNAKHAFIPASSLGFWVTYWQKVGLGTVQRQKFNDCRVAGLTIEASTGTKALRVTPSLLSVDPGEIYTADPTTPMPTAPVLLFNEATGTFTVNGVVIRGHSQFQIGLDLGLAPVYGDDTVPLDLARGNPAMSLAVTIAANDEALAHYNREMYGTAAPVAGTKPTKRIPDLGAYSFDMQKKDSAGNTIASLNALFPGVRWQIPDSPGPNPGQGNAEIALAGSIRKLGALDPYTLTVGCQQPAFTG